MSGESRHHLLAPGSVVFIETATVDGTLYDLGDHPGLRMRGIDRGVVYGEYIEFRQLNDRLLAELDEEEGDDYRRELLAVRRRDGLLARAWTYVYVASTAGRQIISSGDWRRG